jgi:hypothetical protein
VNTEVNRPHSHKFKLDRNVLSALPRPGAHSKNSTEPKGCLSADEQIVESFLKSDTALFRGESMRVYGWTLYKTGDAAKLFC